MADWFLRKQEAIIKLYSVWSGCRREVQNNILNNVLTDLFANLEVMFVLLIFYLLMLLRLIIQYRVSLVVEKKNSTSDFLTNIHVACPQDTLKMISVRPSVLSEMKIGNIIFLIWNLKNRI